eukprot:79651_1
MALALKYCYIINFVVVTIHLLDADRIYRVSNQWNQYARNEANHNFHQINAYNSQHKSHIDKYSPYYFTKHVFHAIFGFYNMMDDNDIFETDDDEPYSDRYQSVAFILSVLLGPLGAGRFYAGEFLGGTLKIMLSFLTFSLPVVIHGAILTVSLCMEYDEDVDQDEEIEDMTRIQTSERVTPKVGYLLQISILVWWIVDIILFAINNIPNEDGLYPIPW